MECQTTQELIYDYIDGLLGETDLVAFEKHLQDCPKCRQYLEENKKACCFLQDNYEQDVPESFRQSLMEKITPKEENNKYGFWQRMMNYHNEKRLIYIIPVALVLVLFLGIEIGNYTNLKSPILAGKQKNKILTNSLSSVAGKSPQQESLPVEGNKNINTGATKQNDMSYDTGAAKGSAVLDKNGTYGSSNSRKVIRNQNVSLEVQDYQKADTTIMSYIDKYQGYIESSNTSSDSQKTGSYVIRVPADKLSALASDISKLGQVKNMQINGQDVTSEFRDNEARLKALQKQEERLTALLGKAGSLQDVLAMEKEMERVRQEIEIMQSRLQHMDEQVSLATLSLHIIEVGNPTKIESTGWRGLLNQTRNAFVGSINGILIFSRGLIIFLGGALPFVAIIGLFFGIGWYVFRKKRK